jgi:hypothetical protein
MTDEAIKAALRASFLRVTVELSFPWSRKP